MNVMIFEHVGNRDTVLEKKIQFYALVFVLLYMECLLFQADYFLDSIGHLHSCSYCCFSSGYMVSKTNIVCLKEFNLARKGPPTKNIRPHCRKNAGCVLVLRNFCLYKWTIFIGIGQWIPNTLVVWELLLLFAGRRRRECSNMILFNHDIVSGL